jgi:HAD superfamily hydrolase (TIGR01509 family)
MIEGVLFDSGGVLIGSRGGRWWPIFGFEDAVLSYFPAASFAALEEALVPAMAYMERAHPHEDWREFYRLVIAGLGFSAPDQLLDDIANIQPSDAVAVFDDVLPCLASLRQRGIRMAVVSDSWPNLPDMHAALGIRAFFDGYAISSVLGCAKPDPRLFDAGARVLGLDPAKLLFVDDCDDLVHAAIGLGYHGVALLRSGRPPEYPVPWITGLPELDQHL